MRTFTTAPLRVMIQHSEPIVAMGLVSALAPLPGLDVFADGLTGHAHEASAPLRVVVCEYEAGLELAAEAGSPHVVVLTRRPREFEIQRAIEHGVLGYVVTGCSIDELQCAVLAAAQGRRFLCRGAAQEMANSMTAEALTLRERDVLVLLAQGRCNKTIASRLDIAVGTVKAHVRAIMGKLKASSRTQAASIAAARGLLPEPVDEAPEARSTWRPAASMPMRAPTPKSAPAMAMAF